MPIRERLQQRRFGTLADEAVVSLMVAAEHFDQAIARSGSGTASRATSTTCSASSVACTPAAILGTRWPGA